MGAGALGASISGSGPSVFTLCESKDRADKVARAKQAVLDEMQIRSKVFVSGVNREGCKIVKSE